VVAVEQQRQGGRPSVAGEVVEAFDFSGSGAVYEEAEDLVDAKADCRWFATRSRAGPSRSWRALFRMEEAIHGGDSGGLVLRQVFSVDVAGGEDLQDG